MIAGQRLHGEVAPRDFRPPLPEPLVVPWAPRSVTTRDRRRVTEFLRHFFRGNLSGGRRFNSAVTGEPVSPLEGGELWLFIE